MTTGMVCRWLFSGDGGVLVNVSEDQRIKVWESARSSLACALRPRQDFTPADHLKRDFTAGDVLVTRVAEGSEDAPGCFVALGTSEGTIVVWDLVRGEARVVIGEEDGSGHVGPVTSVLLSEAALDGDGGRALAVTSAGIDGYVKRWVLSRPEDPPLQAKIFDDAHPSVLCAIAGDPKERFVAAALGHIAVVDPSTLAVQHHRKGGVLAPVSARAVYSVTNKHETIYAGVASAAREVHFVQLNVGTGAFEVRVAKGTEAVHNVCIWASKKKRECSIVALGRDSARVWTASAVTGSSSSSSRRKGAKDAAGAKGQSAAPPLEHKYDIKIGGSKANGGANNKAHILLAAHVRNDNPTFVFGHAEWPTFQEIAAPANVGSRVELQAIGTPTASGASRTSVGDISGAQLAGSSGIAEHGDGEGISAVTFDGNLLPSIRGSPDEFGRLKMESLEDTVKHMALVAQPEQKLVQRADSVAAVVVQAIHSSDALLLEHALQSGGDHRMIDRTVQELPSQAIVPLLEAVIERIVRRPARAVELVRWVTSILQQHTGYLMSAPDVAVTLSHLQAQLNARVKPLDSLLNLHGRLQLLLAHDRVEEDDQQPGPLVYNEASESDDDSAADLDDDMDGEFDSDDVNEMDGELMDDEFDEDDLGFDD